MTRDRTTNRFLPMTMDEMAARRWPSIDVLLITADAYLDHPSFGAAVIGRVLERAGYRVGIVARPDWRSLDDFRRLGRPGLFVGVTGGAVDSAVNNYTAHGAKRRKDLYAPDGMAGGRPDFATLVYANRAREAFPEVPVVLGGIEASLRRFAYFDARKSKVRRAILVDSRADILVCGAGEQPVLDIARRLAAGQGLDGIPGTARLVSAFDAEAGQTPLLLPDFSEIEAQPGKLLAQTIALEAAARPGFSERIAQRYREGVVLMEPPVVPSVEALDLLADLPFAREQHPIYKQRVPALETVRWSIVSHRGCPGGCSFCALAAHQGRRVTSRSQDSILEEIKTVSRMSGFRGTITDVGGPTANAYGAHPMDLAACRDCARASCLYPRICRHLNTDHTPLLKLLDRAAGLPGIAHLFLASGIRHDLALTSPDFIAEVARRFTGGHLKAAPEHVAPEVLKLMRKPAIHQFEEFEARFREAGRRVGKEQYVVPYFIAGFPGCTPAHAEEVRRWLASRGQNLRQAQSFMPLAGTAAAAMVAARTDTKGRPLFIPDLKECRRQKEMLVSHEAGRKGRMSG